VVKFLDFSIFLGSLGLKLVYSIVLCRFGVSESRSIEDGGFVIRSTLKFIGTTGLLFESIFSRIYLAVFFGYVEPSPTILCYRLPPCDGI